MVMVGSGRKTAEVLVIRWLHARRPPSSTARPAPTAALLCRMVTAEVTASPKRHCCFLERRGRAGVFLLPEGESAQCLGPFRWRAGFLLTPSIAGGACGGADKPLLVAPCSELFPIRVCLGFQEKLDGLGNSLGTLHPEFSTATLWGHLGCRAPGQGRRYPEDFSLPLVYESCS